MTLYTQWVTGILIDGIEFYWIEFLITESRLQEKWPIRELQIVNYLWYSRFIIKLAFKASHGSK